MSDDSMCRAYLQAHCSTQTMEAAAAARGGSSTPFKLLRSAWRAWARMTAGGHSAYIREQSREYHYCVWLLL